jgi:multiple sugar transport system permease protein
MTTTTEQRSTPWRSRFALDQLTAHLLLSLMALLSIAPFVWMFFASLKSFKELVSSQALLPQVWTLNNYREIIQRVNFPTAFANSTIAAITVTAVTLLTSAALGYIFAKYRWCHST